MVYREKAQVRLTCHRLRHSFANDLLSDALLSGTFSDGDVITVDYREDEVVLHCEPVKEPAAEAT